MAEETIPIISSRIQYRLADGRVVYGRLREIDNKVYDDRTGKVITTHAQSQDRINRG